MERLGNLYRELLLQPQKWSYYQDELKCFSNSYETLLVSGNDCLRFIEDYLCKGEKNDLKCLKLLEVLKPIRLQHTISCFLLGILIYHKSSKLRDEVNSLVCAIRPNNLNEKKEDRFKYMWMLICIFHDLGYSIENKEYLYHNNDVQKDISNFFKAKFELSFHRKYSYPKKTIKNYLEYRDYKFNVVDHGIAGGAFLYNSLCNLRARKNEVNSLFYWGEELEKDFYVASYTIACHNIFKISPNTKMVPIYKFFSLESLIKDGQLFSLEKFPLLFLLCLVDSIEPIKITENPLITNNIKMDILDNKIRIDISEMKSLQRFYYLERILGLNSWLTHTSTNNSQIEVCL